MNTPNSTSVLKMNILFKQTNRVKILLLPIIILTLSLVACSSPSKTTQTQPEGDTASSPQTTTTSPEVATATVEDLGEVQFKQDPTFAGGSFDAVNNSGQTTHTISKETPVEIAGWAILSDSSKPADKVIITAGDDNSVVTVVPVDVDRTDVAQSLKNPALEKSGWSTKVDSSSLSSDQVVLKAWAYNAQTKEATLLNNVHTITLK